MTQQNTYYVFNFKDVLNFKHLNTFNAFNEIAHIIKCLGGSGSYSGAFLHISTARKKVGGFVYIYFFSLQIWTQVRFIAIKDGKNSLDRIRSTPSIVQYQTNFFV